MINLVRLVIPCLLAALTQQAAGQSTGVTGGYVLIAPIGNEKAWLINAEKEIVHEWDCGRGAGNATYLLEDGSLLRTGKVPNDTFPARGGPGGSLRKIGWDGTVLWDYTVSDETMLAHHDVEPMPNGNVLVIAWEYHSPEEAIAAGRRPDTTSVDGLWPEMILEIKPQGKTGGEVVWKWRLWDHLIQDYDATKPNYGRVEEHPELVDLNYASRHGGDWIHMNSVDYNAELDQIVLSARWVCEAWVVDHSTTIAEAAGHTGGRSGKGGDLLYRWGNADAYFGAPPEDRMFFMQHDVRWIEEGSPGAGHFLVFNNGDRNAERNFSTVDEFVPPLKDDGSYTLPRRGAYGPDDFTWTYKEEQDFLSNRISGAQRLANGNTLICSGEQGWVFEVTPGGDRVWEVTLADVVPGSDGRSRGGLFRAPFYPAAFPAFRGKNLSGAK